MTTLGEFTDPVYAGLILSFLQDHQIDAVLADENASTWSEARLLVPLRLQVPDDQYQRAVDLFNEFEAAPLSEE